MNNTNFKKFIAPFVDEMFAQLGGVDRVREMYTQMPENIIHFVSGGVYGLVAKSRFVKNPDDWRELPERDIRDRILLNQEETRRLLDLVRLRLESESTTS